MQNIINNGEETAGHRYVLSTDCQGKERYLQDVIISLQLLMNKLFFHKQSRSFFMPLLRRDAREVLKRKISWNRMNILAPSVLVD